MKIFCDLCGLQLMDDERLNINALNMYNLEPSRFKG